MDDNIKDEGTMENDNVNETTEQHSDYKPVNRFDASAVHHLSGMYQNWFLDYASYVILERAVPSIEDGLKPVQRRILHSMKRMDSWRCFYWRRLGAAGTEESAHRHSGKLGKHTYWRPCCRSSIY